MKTISFVSLKGGVGKTTGALSVARILHQEGQRVLLVDLDPQGATTSHFLISDGQSTIRQLLKGEKSHEQCVYRVTDGLDLYPSELELGMIEQELSSTPNRDFQLFEVLKAVDGQYDICIIDTPPQLGLLTYGAVIASDWVIIPTQAEKWAARAVGIVLQALKPCRKAQGYIGKGFSISILVTFMENRKIKTTILEILQSLYPDVIAQTMIHTSTEVAKTYAQTGKQLPTYSRPAGEYREFLKELGCVF